MKYVQKKFKNLLTLGDIFVTLHSHTDTITINKQKKMRTKTLLLTAAMCAAGAVSSMAQVYSVNIVGYVTVTTTNNVFALLANPLDDGTNKLSTLLAAMPNKSSAQFWNGTAFTGSTKGAGVWTPDTVVPVGTGFFLKTPSDQTNTFVGQVIVGPGGSVTNTLDGSLQLKGSPIPFSATLNSTTLGLNILPNKSSVQVWNGTGFSGSTRGAGTWTPDLNIVPAQGFFIQSKTATNWVQTLP